MLRLSTPYAFRLFVRTLLLWCLLVGCALGPLRAQELQLERRAIEQDFMMDGKPTTALVARVEGDYDQLRKIWSDYTRKKLDIKLQKKGNLLQAEKINLYAVTDKRGDLLSVVYNDEGQAQLAVAYAIGYDIFLNSREYPQEFFQFEEVVNRFLDVYYRQYYENLVKEKTSLLKDTRKQIRKAEQGARSLEKDNRKSERTFAKALKKDPNAERNPESLAKTEGNLREIERLRELRSTLENEAEVYEEELQRAKLQLIDIRSRSGN
ncbi:hypothetical protein SAMN05421823_103176 [Catalinimonas alkaloidigena]|uniref:Uncharacterized protein n=1 Tax=Catalinimonas alkaloidigena TaxID=1075417 RepID=A0A1G9DLY5_9BACT|nr:hypothetical protein [Catalinimonas alkaloidigena]SDK64883.1 hypothetical protein SAMN05421823_103176 [Catalinimonas alkaloidigena]